MSRSASQWTWRPRSSDELCRPSMGMTRAVSEDTAARTARVNRLMRIVFMIRVRPSTESAARSGLMVVLTSGPGESTRAPRPSGQRVLLPRHLIDWNGCHTILKVFAAVIDGSAVFFLAHQHDGNAEPRLH